MTQAPAAPPGCTSVRTTGRPRDGAKVMLRQDDLHLVEGERGAQTVAQAAAEREERVRVDALVDEAVGPECLGLGPDVGAPVGEVDAG